MSPRSVGLLAVAVIASLLPAARAGVVVVDTGPPGPVVQTAVDADADSEIVLLEPGDPSAIFVGSQGAALSAPGKQGVWSPDSPVFGPWNEAVNPVGEWTLPSVAGSLTPPTLQGQSFLLRLVASDGGQVLFEGNSAYVLVDSSIP